MRIIRLGLVHGNIWLFAGTQKTEVKVAPVLMMPAVALTPALTLSTAVAPRTSSALTILSVYRSSVLISCIFTVRVLITRVSSPRAFITRVSSPRAFIVWARTTCSRACGRAQAGAGDRDDGRDCSAHAYTLGYCERTSGCDVTDIGLNHGCYRA